MTAHRSRERLRPLVATAALCVVAATSGLQLAWAEDPAAAPVASAATNTARPDAVAHNDGRRAIDRLELDTTAITGNRELPKVMSIVPWKPAEPPGGPDRPMGSLIEEMLSPVDRDEFRREITYYRELTSQSSQVAGAAAPAPEAERPQSPSARSPGATLP
jgi:hypothetical protein